MLPILAHSCADLPLSTPPYPIAADANITEFSINITDAAIQELNTHLQLFRPPPDTYENSYAGWDFGVPKKWLVDAVDYWQNSYDW